MSSNTKTANTAKPESADSSGMYFLETRQRKIFATYLPLGGFLFV